MSKAVEYYHHLHQYPELSNQEVQTSAYIENALKAMEKPSNMNDGAKKWMISMTVIGKKQARKA